jgi:hypothetical protein
MERRHRNELLERLADGERALDPPTVPAPDRRHGRSAKAERDQGQRVRTARQLDAAVLNSLMVEHPPHRQHRM